MAKRRKSKTEQAVIRKITIFAVVLVSIIYLLDNLGIISFDKVQTGLGLREEAASEADASVHFIDVGQGDCTLILSEDAAVLIDAGESEYSEKVIAYIQAQGVKKLDYIIATHPHSDHIGSLSDVIKSFEIGTVFMPYIPDEMTPTSYSYENFLTALVENDVNTVELDETKKIVLSDISLTLYPPLENYDNLNDYSIITKMTHGKNTFLFSGDAESKSEKDHIENGEDLSAKVYKAGHHGSNTSSSDAFLSEICPEYCIISCGADNSYNHPGEKAVNRIKSYTDIILRTDLLGTIVFESDGKTLNYFCENG
ncbi:MAG: ComEC/Rec2 family competence protein [Oscillospiraceae bacterium]|jgi:competence protein ComEC